MRVAIVCPYSLATPGGVQSHVLALAPALAAHGVVADVLAPTDGDDGWNAAAEAGVALVSLGPSVAVPANGSTARIALRPGNVARLLRVAADYDVCHVHEPFVPGAPLALVLRRPVPLVGTFHAATEGGYRPYAIGKPVFGRAWRNLAVRTGVSPAAIARVRPYFGDEIELSPNGVDVARFAGATSLPERTMVGGPVVLFVGRDEPRKGLDVLRDAWPLVRARVPDAELWVAGPGTEPAVRSLDGVRAWGGVDADTLASLYASADVFCAPARGGESFGIVLLEAMAAGVAVCATDIPGYAAVARPGEEGELVPPEDPAALADALVTLCDNPIRRERLVEAGRQRAAAFDWAELAGAVADRYRRALATPTPT